MPKLPIYSCSFEADIYTKKKNTDKHKEALEIDFALVKGFTKDNIIKTNEESFKKAISKQIKLKPEDYFKVKNLKLLAQHGTTNDY